MGTDNYYGEVMNTSADPNWILRGGQYIVILIFILGLLLSSFFSFNETIKGKLRIISKIPPAEIIAKQSGKLQVLNYQAGDTVMEGVVLGIIENSANENDVEYLKKNIESLQLIESIDSLKKVFPSTLRLGNLIQPSYHIFLETYQELMMEKLLKDDVLIQSQLHEKIKRQKRISGNKHQEFLSAERAYKIKEGNLERHRSLYNKGVISHHEFEKVENEFLISHQNYEIISQQMEELKIELDNVEKERKLAESLYLKFHSSGALKLEAARENLLNSILEWEENYLFISPISGKLSINHVWGKFQNIQEGEMMFLVVPLDTDNIFGRCKVPVRNSGKIMEGQSAFLKIDNYPYREWGILKGKVESISGIQGSENEELLVSLSIDSLITTYGKELKFSRELLGEAEIILEETRVIERIFYQFRHLWLN